ncbi:MAG: thioredoxin domain-containing protein [Desulfuromonadales bacterium]|nr:thioredoxin domain-containing protein [Desulfuromonadales bacterium]
MKLDSRAHLAELIAIDKNTLPADGGDGFNRLIFARSPYLLQHAENPVNWYEWGQAAFDLARDENRPVLLSIGYATCHWCHVMAHESFEDQEVADLLNRHFVCIKVDREERPDIDDFYMTVAQVLTGRGGWPLNIFMTPDRRPFFAMTYLPKQDRQGMRGLMGLLGNIAVLWRQQPDKIENNCSAIMETLVNISQPIPQEATDLEELNQEAFRQLSGIYDEELGGFGASPKFPMPVNLSWLIEQGAVGNTEALEMALHTLRSMRRGGIWDQLGGGLHRYSVDQKWLVPHFEKMLYDQAMLALVSLEAFQADGDPLFLDMALEIYRFVDEDLTAPMGGIYSALDADSEGEEGRFYIWTKDEIDEILGTDAPMFCRYFDVSSYGNFEGSTILNIPTDIDAFCAREECDRDELEEMLERCGLRLLEQRATRIHPLRDEKIITAWNGLMIAALARGGAISGVREFIERAGRAATCIMEHLRRPDGRLLRSFMGGPSDIPAFLEDYAFLTFGLIELFEATLDSVWLDKARGLADDMLRLFYDNGTGEFSKTGSDAEQMPIRASLEHDGVLPSPFSMAAKCFIRLAHACDCPELLDHAHALLAASLDDARRHPAAHLGSIQALTMLEHEPVLATFRGKRDSTGVRDLLQQVKAGYIPNLIIMFESGDAAAPSVSLCARGTCYPPAGDPADLARIILEITAHNSITSVDSQGVPAQ